MDSWGVGGSKRCGDCWRERIQHHRELHHISSEFRVQYSAVSNPYRVELRFADVEKTGEWLLSQTHSQTTPSFQLLRSLWAITTCEAAKTLSFQCTSISTPSGPISWKPVPTLGHLDPRVRFHETALTLGVDTHQGRLSNPIYLIDECLPFSWSYAILSCPPDLDAPLI